MSASGVLVKLALISGAMRLFSWIPPRAAEIIAPPLAAVLWYLSPGKRRVTSINLSAAFPDMTPRERRRMGRMSMMHYVRGVFEAGMLWYWPLERVQALFDETEGLEFIEKAEREGRGLIVAAPHCGSWEMLNLFLHRDRQAAILYKPSRHPDIDQLLAEKRSRAGAQMVPATGAGLRTMFKLLKSGHFVALLPDQEPTRGDGGFAPFYGVEALTGVLLPRMAKRAGVPIIFAVCERRRGGRYCVHLFKPDDAIYGDDRREALTAVNKGVERCIDVDRDQYLWAYKRYRQRPDGGPSMYRRPR